MENRFLSVLDGLEKARKGLALYALLVAVLTVLSFVYAETILQSLVRLMDRKLVAYDPSEGFLGFLSLALYCGLALSLPAGTWLLWRGAVAPRVPRLRHYGTAVIGAATALFAAGVLLGYLVLLPAGIRFLVGFESREVRALISARGFISFCGTMLLALGLSFQAPLVSFLLARMGWLGPSFFRKNWRYAVLACTVTAAAITPTPDAYNLFLMACPLLGLYFVSFGVVWAVGRRVGGDGGPTPGGGGGGPTVRGASGDRG